MAGSRRRRARSSACGTARRAARGGGRRRIAPRSSARAREADWLRHAVEELARLAPEPAEETALAERRTAMMQVGEGRGRPARRARRGGGRQSPVPALSAAVRRLERRGAQAPALIEPAVKALDAALNALDEARAHLEHALRVADHDPRELERIEERLFALRAAGRKYNSPVDALNALAEHYAADLALIDAGAERLAALEKAAREARRALSRRRPRRCRRRGARRAEKLDKAVNGELKPLKLERAKFSTADRKRAGGRRAERHRPRRILGADQSGHAAGPADEGRLRRRAGALPAGAQGGAGRSRLGADAGVRRDRHRRRRRGGRRHRRAAGAAGASRRRWSPSPTRRRSRRAPSGTTSSPRMRWTRASGWRPASPSLRAERRREEIARMLAGAEITAEARAAAERLIKAAG